MGSNLYSELQIILKLLPKYRDVLTPHQYGTLKGQALSGDPGGAMKGLRKLLARRRRENDRFK